MYVSPNITSPKEDSVMSITQKTATAEIFNDYNKHCTAETSIDEIKSG